MEDYKSAVEDFIECNKKMARDAAEEAENVARKAQTDNEAAISTYNGTVESFNKRAGQ